MCNARASVAYSAALLLLVLHSVVASVSAQGSTAPSPWPTLSGDAPIVIARGGFSGLLPDSSSSAYSLALMTSLPNVVLWCDVRLTKDAAGICFPDIKLENASDISSVLKDKESTYPVNGVSTKAFFSVDFTLKDLSNVVLTQGLYSRSSSFDGNLFPILTVEDVATQVKPPGLWLNIQHDAFYTQHKLSMRSYVLAVSRRVVVNYISSPEVGFLKSIATRFSPKTTKLIFRFLGKDEIEPSTNQTYGSLLTNLTFIKTFASGILVPKTYIWPVDAAMYLQPHTTLVSDAHKAGLEVYASDFMNDATLSYNYSYDPLAEYLSFVDNGNFSVDGVLSDFPITPSEAIDCFSHLGQNDSAQVKTLVISKNGASGDYPGCTDMAYATAISDGVDILDCSVQMSKDGTAFCLSTMNLIESTTVAQSDFSTRSMSIPEINAGSGIYTFSLTWDEIQTLTPSISNPYSEYRLFRNPKNKNKGKFLSLSDFLALTNSTTSLTGALISIENAAYLAENQGLGVTDAVLDALRNAGYDSTTSQKVMIQSTNSSVLMKFKEKSNYELVYKVDETIRDALTATIDDIKAFADSVVIGKASVFPENQAFLTGSTDVVQKLQKANLTVYVETFDNEFVSQAWDFFSDSTVEINSYVAGAGIDGVITSFPKTAATYKKNLCLNLGNSTPAYMSPVQPGSLMQLITTQYLPPAEAPFPVLKESDVAEPPLPPVSAKVPSPSPAGTPSPPNGQPKSSACFLLLSLALLLGALVLF